MLSSGKWGRVVPRAGFINPLVSVLTIEGCLSAVHFLFYDLFSGVPSLAWVLLTAFRPQTVLEESGTLCATVIF